MANLGPSLAATDAGVTTLLAVRTAIRQRCDMVNSTFVTDGELTGYVNASYYELYDLLLQHYGDNYYVATPATFQTDGTADRYDLPKDLYKLLGVDLKAGTNQYITIAKFQLADRNRYSLYPAGAVTSCRYTPLRYQLVGNQIWFIPRPTSGQTIQLYYVPRLAALVNDADVIDGVSGYEEYVIVDCCIKMLAKEESDTSVFMAQKQSLLQRIESAAANRDAGQPQTTRVTQGQNGWDDFGGMGYGGW